MTFHRSRPVTDASLVGSPVVGIDVGGTFTDMVVVEPGVSKVRIGKLLTDRSNPAGNVMRGLSLLNIDFERIGTVVHGTTIGTNALLERSGSCAALLTTDGFRDVLELRRRDRPDSYGLRGTFRPLIPRQRRFEVSERIDSHGRVLEHLDVAQVRTVIRHLPAEVEAIAISLFNSHASTVHEERIAMIVREMRPDLSVSVASQLAPELGEFERCSTAAADAYIAPALVSYLRSLERFMAEAGYSRDVLIVQSSGTVVPAPTAAAQAIRTTLSGPAAGVAAAAQIARQCGEPNAISCDMGGTSFDVAVVTNGRPGVTSEKAIDFGVVIRAPMIDIHTIGAGGGSIARVTSGGILRVGPQSAGAVPGPAAYGLGGTEATVTDANVVVGRLGGDRPLGSGAVSLDVDRASAAVRENVARPLGLGVEVAAEAIIAVATTQMAAAIRHACLRSGIDPEKYSLVVFGGAGPLHAGEIAAAMGIRKVILPDSPGLTSAWGCISADMSFDSTVPINARASEASEDLGRIARFEAERLRSQLALHGHPPDATRTLWFLDMSFSPQRHHIPVPIEQSDFDRPGRFETCFREAYRDLYGSTLNYPDVHVWNLRTVVTAFDSPERVLVHAERLPRGGRSVRQIHEGGSWRDAHDLPRSSLEPSETLTGPAVLHQIDSTIFVPTGMTLRCAQNSHLILESDFRRA